MKFPEYHITSKQFAESLLGGVGAFQGGIDDVLVAMRTPTEPIAWAAFRPLVWCHGFHFAEGVGPHERIASANGLFAYARGLTQASMVRPRGCIFQTSSGDARMGKLAFALGAVSEPDSKIYRIDYL